MTEEQFWRLQGRLNAIELVILSDIYNLAKTQPTPFLWVQEFIAAMGKSGKTLVPDAMTAEDGDRLKRETKAALDDFLADVARHAGQLKGAPENP